MFCVKCGKELNEGEKFCPACGTKLGQGVSLSSIANQGKKLVSEASGFAKEKGGALVSYAKSGEGKALLKDKKFRVYAVSGLVFVIMLVCAIVLLASGRSSREKKALATVRSGHFYLDMDDEGLSVEERIEKLVTNTKWTTEVVDDDTVNVYVQGDVTYNSRPATIKITFSVDDGDDNFAISRVTVDGKRIGTEELMFALYN